MGHNRLDARSGRGGHDIGAHRLARLLVGNSDDSHLEDTGNSGYRFLDIVRVDVKSTDQNHVLLAIHDGEVTIGVHLRDVSGVQPAIPQGVAGFCVALPVALHDLRSLGNQFTRFTHRNLCAFLIHARNFGGGYGDSNAVVLEDPTQRVEGKNRG